MFRESARETKLTNRLFLLLVIVSLFGPVLLSGLFAEGGIYENAGITQETIVSELLYFVMAAAFIALGGKRIFESVRLGKIKPVILCWVCILSFLLQPVMLWLNMITMSFVENHVAASAVRASGSFWINLIYLAAVPAMVEEFVFRGLIYHGLRDLGIRRAVLLSALMFGLLHLNINQFVYAFCLGIVFAVVVEITESLYSSMLLHFLINARSVMLLSSEELVNSLLTQNESVQAASSTDYLLSAAVYTPFALICSAGVIWSLRKMADGCGKTLHPGPSAQEGFATPAFLAGLVLCIVYMIRFDLMR